MLLYPEKIINLVALPANRLRFACVFKFLIQLPITMRYFLHRSSVALIIVLFAGFFNKGAAQVTIAENDTTICLGVSKTVHASNPAGLPVGAAITVDDHWSLPISLSFPFTFYGNTYTQCLISTNGVIGFNLGNSNQGHNWLVAPTGTGAGGPIPGNTDVLNAICTNFSDIDPSQGGQITYTYAGVAPNRKFIVTYCDVPMYDCPTVLTSFQTILYEGSNKIEMFLRSKPVCTLWPTPPGIAIQGLQNEFGGVANVVPGRNYPNVWTAQRDGRRFTPNGPNDYTIDSIPFTPIALAGNAGFTWYTLPNNVINASSTNSITVSPTQTTTYYVRQVYCSDTTIDSIRIVVGGNPQIRSVQTVNPTYCGATDGSLILKGLDHNVNYDVHYSKNGVPQPSFMAGSSANGDVTIPNLEAAIYNFISVSVGVCPAGNTVGPYTLFNPPIPVDFTTVLKPSCGGIDTVVFTNTTPTPGTINYTWEFGDGTTATDHDPSHVYSSGQGVYSVRLTADNGICRDSIRKNVDTRHPLIAKFKVDYDTACIGQVLNFRDTSTFVVGSANPTYFWDFGDNTTGSGSTPIHAYTQSGRYHVMMVITDFVPCSDTAYMDVYVNVIPTTTFTTNVSSLCEGLSSLFTANFAGVQPSTYQWSFSDGTVIPNTNPVSHSFDASGVYTVTVSTHYQFCPDTFFTDNVTVHPYPMVNLGPDTSLCPGSTPLVLFDHTGTTGTYTWTTGAVTPTISVNTDGIYGITKTVNGCTVSDSITVYKRCYLDIPNAFSPNNDGNNDYFLPRQLLSRGVTAFKLNIYNRWGQLIFETATLDGRGWDGTFNGAIQPQGVYVYVIDVSYEDGRSEHYTNNVTLIR